jgi:hypothetical protein
MRHYFLAKAQTIDVEVFPHITVYGYVHPVFLPWYTSHRDYMGNLSVGINSGRKEISLKYFLTMIPRQYYSVADQSLK